MDEESQSFLRKAKPIIRLKEYNVVVVHNKLTPGVSIEEQDEDVPRSSDKGFDWGTWTKGPIASNMLFLRRSL